MVGSLFGLTGAALPLLSKKVETGENDAAKGKKTSW